MAIYLHYVRGLQTGGGGGSNYVPTGCIQTTSNTFIGSLPASTSNDGNVKRGTNGSGGSGSTWVGAYDSTHGASVIPSSDYYYVGTTGSDHRIPLLPPNTQVTFYLYNNYSTAQNNTWNIAGSDGTAVPWDIGSSYSAYNARTTASPTTSAAFSSSSGSWYRHTGTFTTPSEPAYYKGSGYKGYCLLYFHSNTGGQNADGSFSKVKILFDVWDVGSNSQSFINNVTFDDSDLITDSSGTPNNELLVNLQNSIFPLNYRPIRTSPADSAWVTTYLGNETFGDTGSQTNGFNGFRVDQGDLPSAGNSYTFKLQVRLGNTYGAMQNASEYTAWEDHGDTFTITRVAPTQPTVNNTQTFNTTSASATFSHSIALSSSGSGGSLEYNITQSSARNTNNPSTTLPTSGWQSSSTFTLTRGYYYHFWARRSTGAGDRTNSSLQTPYLPTSLTATIPSTLSISSGAASFDVTVSNASDEQAYRLGTNTTYGDITGTGSPYTSGVISSPATTGTITIPSGASLFPSLGGNETYYLYTSRTDTSGGSGGTGSFSSPGWYLVSGESIVVTRGDADVVITIRYTAPEDFIPASLVVSSSRADISGNTGSSAGQSSGSGIPLGFGETVRFEFTEFISSSGDSCTVSAFDSGEWTSTSSITLSDGQNGVKTRPSSGISTGAQDAVAISVGSPTVIGDTIYFVQEYAQPDTSITFTNPVTMGANDTSYTITLGSRSGGAEDANTANTVYELRLNSSSSSALGNRTGLGNITVSNDIPPFLGIPIERSLYCRLPTANGGSNILKAVVDADDNNIVEIFRGGAPGGVTPRLGAHGIAIYDDQGDLVTSFTENHSILRTIFTGSVTASSTGVVELETGITGMSADNCMIFLTGLSSGTGGGTEYAVNTPSAFNGTKVQIAQQLSGTPTIEVNIMQYRGETLNVTPPDFGTVIRNEAGDVVIDGLAPSYAVREIIPLDTSAELNGNSLTIYTSFSDAIYIFVQLAENRYPTTGGIPIPALNNSVGFATLVPPRIAGTSSNANGSYYSSVLVTIPRIGTNNDTTDYNLAMLVERSNSDPIYYGGQPSEYGYKVYSEDGEVQFDANWRQAVINNIIDANQFTEGTTQNGTYDLTGGTDGVAEPVARTIYINDIGTSESQSLLRSVGESLEITGLNEMDPQNTYVLGGFSSGSVRYYRGELVFDGVSQGSFGGGVHVPGVVITSENTVNLTMARISSGDAPPTNGDRCGKNPDSFHPDGKIVLARIT